ncbi:MAG: glutamine synthetase family protein [Acutalibacteraceae bacterium]
MYSYEEVLTYVEQENVKFIRLAFCDIFGKTKNVSITPSELERAFTKGIFIDASKMTGLGCESNGSLVLVPDPSTLTVLPWRPTHGRVVKFFCDVNYPDGSPYEFDSRYILRNAVKAAKAAGIKTNFAAKYEFYLFKTDEEGNPTDETHDTAGYMDIAPEDKGENIRREICLSLEEMDIHPMYSYHEVGPGQHEIVFRRSDPLSSADNATNFKMAVETIAARSGLYASFMPKPLENELGNAMFIDIIAKSNSGEDILKPFTAGIIKYIKDITLFLNPTRQSYLRLSDKNSPNIISWSNHNLSQLIRICNDNEDFEKIELRSPDPQANPYLACALLIYAGIRGVEENLVLCDSIDVNLTKEYNSEYDNLDRLPDTIDKAFNLAQNSEFVKSVLPEKIIEAYHS